MVRKFDRELKLEAIRMASEEGSTAVELCDDPQGA
jgi:transposase-like protein